jgi:hypothetical protein
MCGLRWGVKASRPTGTLPVALVRYAFFQFLN